MNLANSSLCISLFASVLVSCAGSSEKNIAVRQSAEDTSGATPAATTRAARAPEVMGRHWVQSNQLRNLMKGISANAQRNWPNGVPQDPEDSQGRAIAKTIDDAAKLADGLAAAAVAIPASAAERPMSEADRAGFQAEADILRDQAMRLGQAAHERKIEQMQKSLDAISATCLSCHSRYRDFSGQLDVQRAAADDASSNRRAQLEGANVPASGKRDFPG